MNIPKLRFKEFNDEWIKIDLSTCFEYFSTNSLSREQLSDHGIIKNIHYGDIHKKYGNVVDVENDVAIYIKDAEQINKYEFCCENDIIFADASEDYDGIGKAIELINVNEKLVSGLHTIHARDKKQFFSPLFKGYYFNTPIIHNQIRILANGFKVFGISRDNINNLKVMLPSKQEQEKIAKLLSLLDKKIQLQTKKIEALKLFKKGLLKCEYNKIKSKNLSQLNNVAQIYQPRTLSQKQLKKGVYPVFGANGIIGFNSNFNHKLPQITISCRGENSGSINKTPEYCWINGNSMVINVDNNPNINKDYLKLILESQNLKYLISGSGQPQIIRSDIAKHKIPIISIDEQLIYIKKFNLLESKLPLEISKLKKLNLLKKGLMQNMFI